MNSLALTKYQVALLSELVCPYCRYELNELTKTDYYCLYCRTHFYAEVEHGHDA
jgi:hypothetical protein